MPKVGSTHYAYTAAGKKAAAAARKAGKGKSKPKSPRKSKLSYTADNWPADRWPNFSFAEMACIKTGGSI